MLNLKNIDSEYKVLIRDVAKFATILVVFNLFMFMSNPKKNSLMGFNYITFMTYILMGVLTYQLVIKKLIKFD